jgi:hypothetical protein
MSAFLDETGTLITVDHNNPLPVTIVTTDYTEAELPDADDVAVGTEVFNTTYQVKMRSNGTSWVWLGVGRSTWVNKPATATQGQTICITDVGDNGSLWRGNGTKWVKLNAFVLYSNLTTTSLTGTTLETELATIPVKGGVLGVNGKLRFYILGTVTNNANAKSFRLKHASTPLWQVSYTTAVGVTAQILFLNKNSESSQVTSLFNSSILSGSAVTVVTPSAINTSADFSLTITGQLANSEDSISVTAIFAEIMQ